MFLQQLFQELAINSLGGLLISNPVNIGYVLGSTDIESRSVFLLITLQKSYVVTYAMYQTHLQEVISKRNEFELVVLTQKQKLTDLLSKILSANSKLGFEKNNLSYQEFTNLQANLEVKLEPTDGLIEKFRAIKSSDEIQKISYATNVTRDILQTIESSISNNLQQLYSEKEVQKKVRMEIIDRGGEEGFETIVAIGENAAKPHHIPHTNFLSLDNNLLLIDMGFKMDGFSGDITRTQYWGKDAKVMDHVKVVRECKQFVIDSIHPGVSFGDLHQIAVEFFKKVNLDQFFVHSIGHGLGLEIHEMPFASSTKPLVVGNVITIEPGLYFPGEYGIRDEDVVLITENGYEILGENNS
jgi:Xaa-Pro aminopeptidase